VRIRGVGWVRFCFEKNPVAQGTRRLTRSLPVAIAQDRFASHYPLIGLRFRCSAFAASTRISRKLLTAGAFHCVFGLVGGITYGLFFFSGFSGTVEQPELRG